MNWQRLGLFVAFLLLLEPVGLVRRCDANGGKAKSRTLQGRLADCDFTLTVDPLLFAAGSLKDKYKVLRIKVRNGGERPLKLSAERDAVEVTFGDQKINGLIDLGRADSQLWDQLSPQLRAALAYPSAIEPHEEESLVVFLPEPSLERAPDRVELRIASEDAEVVLRAPVSKR